MFAADITSRALRSGSALRTIQEMARHGRKRIIRDSQSPHSPRLTYGDDVVEQLKTTTRSPSLLVLPLELRLMIYEYVFTTDESDAG